MIAIVVEVDHIYTGRSGLQQQLLVHVSIVHKERQLPGILIQRLVVEGGKVGQGSRSGYDAYEELVAHVQLDGGVTRPYHFLVLFAGLFRLALQVDARLELVNVLLMLLLE